jgi:ABC-type Fe3+ transport system substrate-binding protein
MQELKRLMHSIESMADAVESFTPPGRIDLLLYAPCPVKLAVKDGLDRIAGIMRARGDEVSVCIPMGCTSVDPFDPLYLETEADRLPAIIASIGFGDFWRKEFVERFLNNAVFEAVLPAGINPIMERAGMIDPRGAYTIYGTTPYIFLVDTNRLGHLPVPRTWGELLDPRYRDEIVMCGDGDDMADAVILNLYRERGIEGLRRLAGNVKGIMHSSRMAKLAGSVDPDAAAVFIIPAFFAESTRRPAHVRVVWPEDGAAASPLYLLAKKGERERLADLISFFTDGFAAIESAAWFTPIGLSGSPALPPDASLKWVGWDFIEANDVNRLRDELNAAFRSMQREGR